MKFNKPVFLLVSLLFIVAAAIPLFAQTAETGALAGTVTDSTGAVIPGATVLVTNANTGQTRTVTTGGDGRYTVPLLQPGTYDLRFTAGGFKTTDVKGMGVTVTETPTVNQQLELGSQAEQVTVEANAEAIQTNSAALGTVIGGSQVTALPLTSRNYTNVLALSSGVGASVTNASTLGKGGLDFAVNGNTTQSNNLQIDGANIQSQNGTDSNTDQYNGYGNTPVPNPDALQEFKIQTSQYDAGYGRKAGANVNVITKTGTNVFHGSAFEFLRNTDLNANDFFLNRAGRAKGILNQNQFGGSVGGPIRKNKLFFFASYQGTTQKNGIATYGNSALNLPPIPAGDRSNTAAFTQALGADFCPANHPGSTLFNTLRGGVQVACDGSTINPIAIRMLQFKLPDGSYYMLGSATGQFQSTNITIPASYREDQGLGNIDYIMSQKHTLALKYFNSYAPSTLPLSGNTLPGYAQYVLYYETSALAKVTSILTPSLVNEARISWHRDISDFPGNAGTANNSTFGITPLSPELDAKYKGYLTTMGVTGAYNFGGISGSTFAWSTSHAYQLADQISWTKGKQTLRAGVDLEQGRWYRDYSGAGMGTLAISTFADFLIGRPGCTPGDTACSPTNPTLTNGQPNNGTQFAWAQSVTNTDTISGAGNKHSYLQWSNGLFVNDDIKVSQRLTVNVGLRYEFLGWTHDIFGNFTSSWFTAILKVPVPGNTPATGTLAGWVVPSNYQGPLLDGLTRADNTGSLERPLRGLWAPRFGYAWQPFGGNKFVVRGGFGIFYDRIPGTDVITAANNGPPLAPTDYFQGPSGYFSSLQQPFRIQSVGTYPVRWVDLTTAASSGLGPRAVNARPKNPMSLNYTLNVQYNFLPSWVLEAGYVGTHTINIDTMTQWDPNSARIATLANPIWGITTNTVANSPIRVPFLGYSVWAYFGSNYSTKYNSVQVTLRKQMSHGLQAQAAYTFSKQLDTTINPNYLGIPMAEYGATGRPQRLVLNYSWNVPSGNMKGVLGKLVSGWNLAGVTTIQTGSYLTITDGRGGTIFNETSARAQIAAGKTYADIPTSGDIGSRLGGSSGGCGFFTSPTNTATLNGVSCGSLSPFTTIPAYVTPDGVVTNGTGSGNMGQGVILGPGQFNFDATVSKMTKVGGIHEDATLQFRTEFFNMFNHPQFGNPATAVNSGTFGQISSTTVNPRVIQMALKYVF